ncbi:maleylpyruvate isomerase family mycothiol-dependent enzyme [Nocardioides sp.]|uniref:maleylpyruvate isomerase family mycothiol-dependent enzyme n=1 Tax=Nocardioides sp. TaxID=35761 RepID=UPI00286A2446|nr:maleylpyruvate isomerase family mycothiol-dependent enzyme [Nocardioides sp.]
MTRLDPSTYLDHLRRESARFREVLTDCDPRARVPACPDWDADDLLWHLAEVQWFWARTVRARPAAPDDDAARVERPASRIELIAHFDDASSDLLAELEAADPAEPAWSWAPEQTVGFTFRRQAHEALIHRLDAEQAAGTVTPLDPALAADGVAELLEVMYGGEAPEWGRFEASQHLVRIALTDVGTDLWVRPGLFFGTDPESGRNYDSAHLVLTDPGEASATVSGRAADVDAWLWKRRDDSDITVEGERAAYDALLAATSPPLD